MLAKLRGIRREKRAAHYACALCLAMPNGPVVEVEGRCDGRITEAARGQGGFGYDPIFEGEDGRTFAQPSAAEKNARSHRANAFAQLAPHLLQPGR